MCELRAGLFCWRSHMNYLLLTCTQLCVAPDYVLVPSSSQDKLVEALKKEWVWSLCIHPLTNDPHRYSTFFPDGPLGSSSFSRFGTHGHFTRVKKLLDDTQAKVVLGGQTDAAQKYIAPTIVRDVGLDDSLMSEWACMLWICEFQADLRWKWNIWADPAHCASDGCGRGYQNHQWKVWKSFN